MTPAANVEREEKHMLKNDQIAKMQTADIKRACENAKKLLARNDILGVVCLTITADGRTNSTIAGNSIRC